MLRPDAPRGLEGRDLLRLDAVSAEDLAGLIEDAILLGQEWRARQSSSRLAGRRIAAPR